MDGRKSFIFSWDKKHRKIHEEALLHFFNPSRKGQKFEPPPPECRAPTKSVTQPQPRASGKTEKIKAQQKFEPQSPEHRAPTKSVMQPQPRASGKPEGIKTQQPQDMWDPLQCGSSFKERNTEGSSQSASYGLLPKESPGKAVRSSQDTAGLSMTTSSPSQRADRLWSEATTASFEINEQKGEVSFFCYTNTSGG